MKRPSRPWLVAALWLPCLLALACREAATSAIDGGAPPDGGSAAGSCAGLFGRPTADTGLSAEQCGPRCGCDGGAFADPGYDEAFVARLVEAYALATPPVPLLADPYAGDVPAPEPPGAVCGVLLRGDSGVTPRPYDLVSYASATEAAAAGARVTHFGRCGLCSTLADLAVYLRNNDLTAPVRACGLRAAPDGGAFEADVACLRGLGFTPECARIWAYNTSHTRARCLTICLQGLLDPYNLPDGSLSPCLRCDEEQSGPVFKAVAGRTRRNSGLANAICRPCGEVRPLVHAY